MFVVGVVGVVGVGSVGYEDCEKCDGVEGDGSGDFGRRMCGVKHSEVFQMHFFLACVLSLLLTMITNFELF
jgi:hypothetical protein